jgi:acyl dehydratase
MTRIDSPVRVAIAPESLASSSMSALRTPLTEFCATDVAVVDRRRVHEYVLATSGQSPTHGRESAVPPLFIVVTTWPALIAGPAGVLSQDEVLSTVQAAHDVRYRRPLVLGETLTTEARFFSIRGGPLGTLLTIRLRSYDRAQRLVVEQFVTTFVRLMTQTVNLGPNRPSQSCDRTLPAEPCALVEFGVDHDQPRRYANVSGDHHQIHLDTKAAQAAGFHRPIVHGLCTLAMSCGLLIPELGYGMDRVTRLAAKFSGAVYPGTRVTTRAYDLTAPTDTAAIYGFEATSEGRRVITQGRLELRR